MNEYEADEVRMVSSPDATVKPLAVMVKSINADVADETMATAWMLNHGTARADFLHLKLLKQVHHTNFAVFLQIAWPKTLKYQDQDDPCQY